MIEVSITVSSLAGLLVALGMASVAATLMALLAVKISRRKRATGGAPVRSVKKIDGKPADSPILTAVPAAASAMPDPPPPTEHADVQPLVSALPTLDPIARVTDSVAMVSELETLRVAVEDAVRSGRKDLQAALRMQLAAAAMDRGDSTTACEHWQMARMLFHDLADTSGYKAVDAKMRDNGCPTDWILTDF